MFSVPVLNHVKVILMIQMTGKMTLMVGKLMLTTVIQNMLILLPNYQALDLLVLWMFSHCVISVPNAISMASTDAVPLQVDEPAAQVDGLRPQVDKLAARVDGAFPLVDKFAARVDIPMPSVHSLPHQLDGPVACKNIEVTLVDALSPRGDNLSHLIGDLSSSVDKSAALVGALSPRVGSPADLNNMSQVSDSVVCGDLSECDGNDFSLRIESRSAGALIPESSGSSCQDRRDCNDSLLNIGAEECDESIDSYVEGHNSNGYHSDAAPLSTEESNNEASGD